MTDPHIDPMRDLVEEYSLGMLDADELRAFESRLDTDATLRSDVAAARDALAAMGYAIPVRPDASLRARVLAGVGAATGVPVATPGVVPVVTPVVDIATRRRRSGFSAWIALAAMAAAVVVIAKLTLDLRDVREQAASAEVRVAARDLELAQRDSLIAQLSDPSLELITLAATGPRVPAMRMYIDRSRRIAMVSGSALEQSPAGEAYQLWFFVAGNPAPVPSVTFKAGPDGRAIVTKVTLPEGVITGSAITREPEAGSAAPTSAPLFVGQVAAVDGEAAR